VACQKQASRSELKYAAEFRWIGIFFFFFFFCIVGASHVDFAVAEGKKGTLTHPFVGRFLYWNRPFVCSHCWIYSGYALPVYKING
jgi:hypothetical protein